MILVDNNTVILGQNWIKILLMELKTERNFSVKETLLKEILWKEMVLMCACSCR
jgi:hypothetical protein